MVRVKICGLTNLEDTQAAVTHGADAVGFVFAESPRRVEPDTVRDIVKHLPAFVSAVGVFVNEEMERVREIREYCGLDVVQLVGDESEDEVAQLGGRIIKVCRVGDGRPLDTEGFPGATLLMDTHAPGVGGGTGKRFDWNLAVGPARRRPIILAGGLTPENVAGAVQTVAPYAVDVSSGVEKTKGRKDHVKISCFIRNAKRPT